MRNDCCTFLTLPPYQRCWFNNPEPLPMKKNAGVQKRALNALQLILDGELEDAFLHIATAIDSTSKRRFPRLKSQRERYVKYLQEHQHDLLLIATHGRLYLENTRFVNPVSKEALTIAEAVYLVRNSSVHDPQELEEVVSFTRTGQYGFDKQGRYVINASFLTALVLIVLTDPGNQLHLDLKGLGSIKHGEVEINLSTLRGGRAALLRKYKKLVEERERRKYDLKTKT